MNPLFRIPIRFQLIIIVIIVALPAAGIIIYSGIQQRNRAINAALMDTQRLADRVASEQRIMVASVQQMVISLAHLTEVKDKDATKVNIFLSNILRLHPNLSNIFIADRTGTIWTSAVPFTRPMTIHDKRYFNNALTSGQLSFGEFQISSFTHEPTLNMGLPYTDYDGRTVGVVCVGINLEDYRILLQRTQLPRNADMVLIDRNGSILFSATVVENHIGIPYNQVLFKKMQDGPDENTSLELSIADNLPQQEYYVSYQKLGLAGEQLPYMYIRVGIPVESVFSQINRQMTRELSLFGLVLASTLLLALFVGKRSIVDRMTLLKGASRSLAEGTLQVRVSDLVQGGELGELGESFDVMAQQIALREKSLAEKQRILEEVNVNLEQRVAGAVTELRNKDQMVILQGRQAAMGEMIGNIAHQWRQPLNTLGLIVQGMLFNFRLSRMDEEDIESSVKKAMDIIFHMSRTIDDFSNFFKPDKEKRQFAVNTSIFKTLSLIEPSMTDMNIYINVDRVSESFINGYENEYSQVLLNILLNSRQAFEGCGIDRQRVITITASDVIDKSVVTITDNAGGIPEDIIDKIFDPYFTTKGPDKGTGIGLYMSKAIIEKSMGGRLTVRNTADGAEFRIEV